MTDQFPISMNVLSETSDEFPELAKALASVQAEMKPAVKDVEGQIGSQKRKYADLMSVMSVAQPALGKAGIAIIQCVERIGGSDFLTTQMIHSSGQWISGRVPIHVQPQHQGINDAQAFGAAMTYARRYGLAAILGIVTDDDDDAKSAGEPQKQKQPTRTPHWNPSDTDEFAVCIAFRKAPSDSQKQYLMTNGFQWNGDKFQWEANGTEESREIGSIILKRQPDMIKYHKGIETPAAEDLSEATPPQSDTKEATQPNPVDTAQTETDTGLPNFSALNKPMLMGAVQAMEKKLPSPTVNRVRPSDVQILRKDELVEYAKKLHEMTRSEVEKDSESW